MRMRLLAAASAALLSSLAVPAYATSYSAVVAFGDSLSDNGNLYAATSGLAPLSPPYYNGRFSNGPVSVEQLASQLGAPLLDAAFGGATTGIGNIADGGTQSSFGIAKLPGMQTELAGATIPSSLLSSALFVVWGGADDFESAGSPITAAQNIDGIVAALELQGVTHILVPNLPDLALTPEFYGSAVASSYSTVFNAALAAGLPPGATLFDTYDLLNTIAANPSAYGFSDVTTPCLNEVTNVACSNPGQYLFWDDIHPTTAADAILASDFAAAVTAAPVAATPEPSSLLLLGTGLLGATLLLRRRVTA